MAGGASRASRPSPQAGTLFISLFFAHITGTWCCVAHVRVPGADHAVLMVGQTLGQGVREIQYDRASAVSDTLLIITPIQASSRPKTVRPAAEEATASIPENKTSSLDRLRRGKLLRNGSSDGKTIIRDLIFSSRQLFLEGRITVPRSRFLQPGGPSGAE